MPHPHPHCALTPGSGASPLSALPTLLTTAPSSPASPTPHTSATAPEAVVSNAGPAANREGSVSAGPPEPSDGGSGWQSGPAIQPPAIPAPPPIRPPPPRWAGLRAGAGAGQEPTPLRRSGRSSGPLRPHACQSQLPRSGRNRGTLQLLLALTAMCLPPPLLARQQGRPWPPPTRRRHPAAVARPAEPCRPAAPLAACSAGPAGR